MAIMLFFLVGGINSLLNHHYWWGALFTGFGAFMAFNYYKKATNKEPQVILNAKGIWTLSTPFTTWSDITNEDIIQEGMTGPTKRYLVYEYYPGGYEKLLINDYAIGRQQLKHLLRVYRGRSTKTIP